MVLSHTTGFTLMLPVATGGSPGHHVYGPPGGVWAPATPAPSPAAHAADSTAVAKTPAAQRIMIYPGQATVISNGLLTGCMGLAMSTPLAVPEIV